jgi:uncharacterized membrane protein YccC
MSIQRIVIIAAIIGAMAVFLVYEQSRITRAGYKISQSSQQESKYVEQIRSLNVQVTKLRQPEFIEQQVQRMRIDLARPPSVMAANSSKSKPAH